MCNQYYAKFRLPCGHQPTLKEHLEKVSELASAYGKECDIEDGASVTVFEPEEERLCPDGWYHNAALMRKAAPVSVTTCLKEDDLLQVAERMHIRLGVAENAETAGITYCGGINGLATPRISARKFRAGKVTSSSLFNNVSTYI